MFLCIAVKIHLSILLLRFVLLPSLSYNEQVKKQHLELDMEQ